MLFQQNQIRRELLGVLGLNWAAAYISSSRQQMVASHLSQTLVARDSTERRIQSGMEREFGKQTFSIKMPCNAYILKVVDYYRRAYGDEAIKESPATFIIYEDAETAEIGVLEIPKFCSYHQHFGFDYVPTQELLSLRKNSTVKKGTILANSPSINSHGGYQLGREVNVVMTTHPAIAEDAIVICRDELEHFTYSQYETRTFKFGSKMFPLNLYGDETHYKPFPDIGEFIHSSGPHANILAALRTYDPILGLIEENVNGVREVDFEYDQLIYGDPDTNNNAGGIGGKIIDIRIDHDPATLPPMTPTGMDRQLEKYNNAKVNFHQEIADVYNELFRARGENLRITPEFQQLVNDTIAVLGENRFLGRSGSRDNAKTKVKKEYHCEPIDDWRVTIVIEYKKVPAEGSKFTDLYGGKGVVCSIWERDQMPVDKAGNRAGMIFGSDSTIDRMNPGRLYEQYINAASRDVICDIKKRYGIATRDSNKIFAVPEATVNQIFDELMEFYGYFSPKMKERLSEDTLDQKREHIFHVFHDGIPGVRDDGVFWYMPQESEVDLVQAVADVHAKYPVLYDCVTYKGFSNKTIVTQEPLMIGSMYIVMLEKTGDDWSACDSGLRQQFGLLSLLPPNKRYSLPYRDQTVRGIGEAESRSRVSYAGPEITADIMDSSGNMDSHMVVCTSIMDSDTPTNIEKVIDRRKHIMGQNRSLQISKHLMYVGGWKLRFKRANPYNAIGDITEESARAARNIC